MLKRSVVDRLFNHENDLPAHVINVVFYSKDCLEKWCSAINEERNKMCFNKPKIVRDITDLKR